MFEELDDDSWDAIDALLPGQKGRGRPRADDRSTLNAILYVLTTGCRWDDLQSTQYDHSYTTAWRRLKRWEEQGVLKSVLDALIANGYSKGVVKMDSLSIDSTTIPAKKGVRWSATTATRGSTGRRYTR
jgi:transposase